MNIKAKNKITEIPARTFFLDPRGTSRKTSGSYYTNPSLVNVLIKSALEPVLNDKLNQCGPNMNLQEEALLSLKVCDPACGSGAFLIAAVEYLGGRLAKIRVQDEYPDDKTIRNSRRDILRHCIYGVDINPMSAELAKVSLWLIAATDDQPLNFLDHKIKCGNSLVGTMPDLISKGIPADAYTAVEGDNKETANKRKKLANQFFKQKENNKSQQTLELGEAQINSLIIKTEDLADKFNENNSAETEQLKQEYLKLRETQEFLKNKLIADYWTASFFWEHNSDDEFYPNNTALETLLKNNKFDVEISLKNKITKLSQTHQFFHWYLEFPEVFNNGGFDCIIGNPPWEKIKLQEKEFFEVIMPEIASAENADKRKRMIEKLKLDNPQIYKLYLTAKQVAEHNSSFIRNSNKYPLSAKGDINTYIIFSELTKTLINKQGNTGIIVPTGIATDDSTKDFFSYLIDNQSLVSLIDFENKEGIFPSVHRSYKFCLLSLTNKKIEKAKFSFFNTNLNDFNKNIFTLSKEDLFLINPNTKTCPVFRTIKDAEIIKKIYINFPVLINENDKTNGNPFTVSFLRMFDMTNDSNLFYNQKELEEKGLKLNGNIFEKNNEKYLPLYEGKMIWIYNHRYNSVDYHGGVVQGRHDTIETTEKQLKNSSFLAMPRMWVEEKEVKQRVKENQEYLMGFRDITNSGSERTTIISIIPLFAIGNNMPLITTNDKNKLFLIANMSNIIFDYIVRQKIGGNHINFFICKQLPIIPLLKYTPQIIDYIKPRVLELVYTSYDMKPFAEDLGYTGEPFIWDTERRLILQSELDALYAHLYNITIDELDYILETFPIVKKKDIAKYGEYRTKRLILEKYEELKIF